MVARHNLVEFTKSKPGFAESLFSGMIEPSFKMKLLCRSEMDGVV
jgi:hypothetical protein